jgi:DNA adenine methylase
MSLQRGALGVVKLGVGNSEGTTDKEGVRSHALPDRGPRIADRGSARPLLKWAGGKRQLLPVLRDFYPPVFTRYIEPFCGSAAVFFDLYASGQLDGREAWLVDDNVDLIGCYLTLRDRTEAVVDALAGLEAGHRARGAAHFYAVRDERFNRARQTMLAARDPRAYTPAIAAMLIYLNRTGFNGLFRLNAAGLFNVPAGRYVNPRICDPDHLREVARAFRAPGVTLMHGSFDEALREARRGDLVYCDPPYAPLSATANFTSYTATGFTGRDQKRLLDGVLAAAIRGAAVMVSNSTAPSIAALYESRAVRRLGLRAYRVPARRAINSRASARGPVEEFLLTNLTRRAARPASGSSDTRTRA